MQINELVEVGDESLVENFTLIVEYDNNIFTQNSSEWSDDRQPNVWHPMIGLPVNAVVEDGEPLVENFTPISNKHISSEQRWVKWWSDCWHLMIGLPVSAVVEDGEPLVENFKPIWNNHIYLKLEWINWRSPT